MKYVQGADPANKKLRRQIKNYSRHQLLYLTAVFLLMSAKATDPLYRSRKFSLVELM